MAKARVLVVGCKACGGDELQTRLEAMGHEVVGVVSEESEALALARDSEPDLVVLGADSTMAASCWEVAKALQSEGLISTFLTWSRAGQTGPHASDERFRTLFERTLDVVLIIDGNTRRILEANPAVKTVWGYEPEHLVGEELDTVMPSLAGDDAPSLSLHDLTTRQSIFEARPFRRADGSVAIMDVSATIVPWQGGDAILATLRDVSSRELIQARLKERERFFSLLAENATDVVSCHTSDGAYVYVSPSMRSVFGYLESDILGHALCEFIHPDDVDKVRAFAKRIKDEGSGGSIQYRQRRKDGAMVHVENALKVAHSEEELHGAEYVCSVRDITPRVEAESALRESESRFRELAANINEVFWLREGTTMLYVSPAYEVLTGYPTETMMGEGTAFLELVHPEDKERIVKAFEDAAVEEGTAFDEEFRITRADGYIRWVWARTFPIFNEKGKPYRSAGIGKDITEQRRGEDALRESEERFRYLSEAAFEAIVVHERGHILHANRAYYDMFGYTPEELEGIDAIAATVPPDYLEHVRNQAEGNKAEVYETIALRKNGVRFPIEIRGQAGTFQGRKVRVAVIRDVTEQKRSEEQVRSLTQELIRAQETERQRISRDLHDHVAQDLSTLKIACEHVFDEERNVDQETKRRMGRVSALLSQVIQAVRDLAYGLRPSGLDHLGLVCTMSQDCGRFSQESGILVDFWSAGMETLQLGPEVQINLYRVFQEALNNIRKHAAATQVAVKLIASSPNVILRIEDDGRGFDTQQNKATSGAQRHMGLQGMQERVALMGGTMRLLSRPGKGTRIVVEVPHKEKQSG